MISEIDERTSSNVAHVCRSDGAEEGRHRPGVFAALGLQLQGVLNEVQVGVGAAVEDGLVLRDVAQNLQGPDHSLSAGTAATRLLREQAWMGRRADADAVAPRTALLHCQAELPL